MANDSAANDPATHCQRKRKKNTGTMEKAAKGRIGINFPGEREGERRNPREDALAPPTGSNCISTPKEREAPPQMGNV